MPQCDKCLAEIDTDSETHIRVVKPMEFKGQTRKVTQYYCTLECLFRKVGG